VTGHSDNSGRIDVDAIERLLGSLTAELRLLRDQRAAVLAIHHEFDGRCVECVEYCDCDNAARCGHGNVEWPCRTATACSLPGQGEGGTR
jgi:hypothetical protein